MADTPKPITQFTAGGTLSPRNPTYIERQVNEELLNACLNNQFAYIFACRQIGKSSVVVGTAAKLREKSVRVSIIDLAIIGKSIGNNSNRWYLAIISELINSLDLQPMNRENQPIGDEEWWNSYANLSLPQRFTRFLEKVVLTQLPEHVVIFLDEIDTMLGLSFTDDFLANIRSIYNLRADNAIFERVTFVLVGVATPNELIDDSSRTPFNLGKRIDLIDFTKAELAPYRIALINRHPQYGQQYFEDIFAWTNGHPYLTQKLCSLIFTTDVTSNKNLVDDFVGRDFLTTLGSKGIDDNIIFVTNSVTKHSLTSEMLAIYQLVVTGQSVADDVTSEAVNRLKLTGLVVAKHGRLRIRNKLYETFFNADWVKKARNDLKSFGLPPNYDIIQTLSKDEVVTVYRAINTESGKMVALKVLDFKVTQIYDKKPQIEQFKAEIEVIRQFNHPHIIEIYKVGESNTSRLNQLRLYMEMPFITGGTLADRMEKNPIRERHIILILLQQISSALMVIHSKGYIHRDIKPSNILLDSPANGNPHAILADFGMATLINMLSDLQGTLSYAAPEQYEQEHTLTPAVDIYALALVAYELFAGRYSRAPLPLLTDDKAIFNEVLAKATFDNPAARYQTVAEFVDTLVDKFVQRELQRALWERDYPDTTLQILDPVLEVVPNELRAIQLKSQLLSSKGQRQEAIETLTPTFEQTKDITTELGEQYVTLLKGLAEDLWQQQKYREAMNYYEQINQLFTLVSAEKLLTSELQQLKAAAFDRQVEYYFQALDEVPSEEFEIKLQSLDKRITKLNELQAKNKATQLAEQKRKLQIKYYFQGQGETPTEDFEAKLQSLDRRITKLTELQATDKVAELAEQKRVLQVKYYYNLGFGVYAQGQPKNIAESIQQLEIFLKQVKEYQGHNEAIDLQAKLTDLQNQRDYQLGLGALQAGKPQEVIERVKSILKVLDDRQSTLAQDLRLKLVEVAEKAIHAYKLNYQDESVFYYYLELDILYKTLILGEKRLLNVEAKIALRQELARQAEEAHDYSLALKHLRSLQQSPVYKILGEAVELTPTNLELEIKRLEDLSQLDKKLQEVDDLARQREYQEALKLLNQTFISQNIYQADNRDLLALARDLLYATQHDHLPVVETPVVEAETASIWWQILLWVALTITACSVIVTLSATGR